jgi:DNA-directed RNA polymerase delta subunit
MIYMKNILQEILKEKKEKELIRLNAVEIVNALFNDLEERERDILSRRFSLGKDGRQTLEEIGGLYNLTRERVRQIERASLKKLKEIEGLDKQLSDIKEVVSRLLEDHGGIMEREFLLDVLTVMSSKLDKKEDLDKDSYKKYLEFMLSSLLDDHVEKVDDSNKFTSFFKFKDQAINYLEEMVDELKNKLEDLKKTMRFEDLVSVLKDLKSFSSYKDKILRKNDDLDLKEIYKEDVFPEWGDIIDKHKPLYSFMQAVKDVNPNKFGDWGKDDWSDVKPRRIADKIYLILKNKKNPMHFSKITEEINNIGFDDRKVNSGSVHNELILDDRYILTGRGTYGLKEWAK